MAEQQAWAEHFKKDLQVTLEAAVARLQEQAGHIFKELEARAAQTAAALDKAQPKASAASASRATFVRQVTLDKFAGESAAVRGWLYALDVATRGASDDEKIDVADLHLTGTARSWAMQLGRAQTWREWVARFESRFAPLSDTRLRLALDTLRQETTVQDYISRFSDIVQQLPDLSEEHKVFQFVKGLRANIGAEVRARAPRTFIDAARLADQFEDGFFGGSRARGAGHHGGLAEATGASAVTATPMDIAALEQQLAALRISTEEEIAALREGRFGRNNASRSSVKCWYCDRTGHMQADCRKRQHDNAPLVRRPQQGRPRPNGKTL
eukprot:TRINITY_DN1315_c0_g1_i12.p1 TRINITY_DN1315_c0_g1~~TRINITY_DN1315_c0_g1_i12.p1  ORF type:complete len:326 (+),score=57.41 TRINITY_DN1315_c0_g1_i12:675-1652(+)